MSKGKLSYNRKKDLQKSLEELLCEVPQGQRIKLDKEILEELIFTEGEDKVKGKKVPCKFITWSGPFLRKIDLSEVSFEDVHWSLELCRDCYSDKIIDLSGTNINPDFEKSFARKNGLKLCIKNCNFTDAELSNVTLTGRCDIINCSFSNSDIKIDLSKINMSNVKLRNLDLSNQVVFGSFFCGLSNLEESHSHFYWVDFSDTGLDITVDDDCSLHLIQHHITHGLLVGCYVNGQRINSDRDNIFGKKYNIDDILKDVKGQIKSFKKPKFFGRR